MAAATFHNRFVLTAQRSYVKENKNQGYYNAGLMVDTCKALFVSKWMSLKLAVFRLGLYRLQRIQIPVSIFFANAAEVCVAKSCCSFPWKSIEACN